MPPTQTSLAARPLFDTRLRAADGKSPTQSLSANLNSSLLWGWKNRYFHYAGFRFYVVLPDPFPSPPGGHVSEFDGPH